MHLNEDQKKCLIACLAASVTGLVLGTLNKGSDSFIPCMFVGCGALIIMKAMKEFSPSTNALKANQNAETNLSFHQPLKKSYLLFLHEELAKIKEALRQFRHN